MRSHSVTTSHPLPASNLTLFACINGLPGYVSFSKAIAIHPRSPGLAKTLTSLSCSDESNLKVRLLMEQKEMPTTSWSCSSQLLVPSHMATALLCRWTFASISMKSNTNDPPALAQSSVYHNSLHTSVSTLPPMKETTSVRSQPTNSNEISRYPPAPMLD